jgi:hypothetical protein
MLSVGRGLNLGEQVILCKDCSWEGGSAFLKTSLVSISRPTIFLYVYRCPECEGLDLILKGKLLRFSGQKYPTDNPNLDSLVHHGHIKKTFTR